MPFRSPLPTTSTLSLQDYISSDSHPSLVVNASIQRSIVRNVLKSHARLSPSHQISNLTAILAALNEYLPYLMSIDAGLSNKLVHGEDITIALSREVEVEWRPCLGSSLPGTKHRRIKAKGLDYEISATLAALGSTYLTMARGELAILKSSPPPVDDVRARAITLATKHLRQANSIFAFAATRDDSSFPKTNVDVLRPVQSAMASLAAAEVNLMAVLKDDHFPDIVIRLRSNQDREWMIKPPEIPKVRAHLFARLCTQAAEHAGKAAALLRGSHGVNDDLVKYAFTLQSVARAKACRFLGIDAEIAGRYGEALGWINAARSELGVPVSSDKATSSGGLKGFGSKLKSNWENRKEDKRVAQGSESETDAVELSDAAGRYEERRVLDYLEANWTKSNDMITHQIITPANTLKGSLPSGQDIYPAVQFEVPYLDQTALARMRAPIDADLRRQTGAEIEDDGKDSDGDIATPTTTGAFPDSAERYF